MILYEFLGTEPISPVAAFGEGNCRRTGGRLRVIVNGRLGEDDASTPVCVPPMAETAYCFPVLLGAVSVAMVYVGDVKPVWAPPVMGEVRVKDMKVLHNDYVKESELQYEVGTPPSY
jgi:hypothetical protein